MRERIAANAASSRMIAVLVSVVAGLIIVQQAPRGLLFLLTDGAVAGAILLAVSLAGLWLVALLRCGHLPVRWQLLLGAGLGIGTLSLLVLVCGLLGWLDRSFWIALLGAMGLSGLPRLVHLKSDDSKSAKLMGGSASGGLETGNSKLAALWLLAAPFAALTILVALVPPGLLWAEEGNGYDVLEYHLQMPREYFEAGRITYAPHNVYANFPSNAEMLYLLAMIVQGDPIAGVGVAQLINAMLAFLTVAAAWLAGREFSPAVGHVTGALAATCGWLVYLSGVAYVENAMLFFGMLSAAAVGSALRTTGVAAGGPHWQPNKADGPQCGPYNRLAIAGLLAGFSAGCKYTAVVLIVIPLILAVLFGTWPSHRRRAVAVAVFGLTAVASFGSWLLKNLAFTGNPVFPLAHAVFPASPEGWSPERSEHFAQSHAPSPTESSVRRRLETLWHKVIADDAQRFGPAVFLLTLASLLTRRHRPRGIDGDGNPRMEDRDRNLGPAVMLAAQIALWLALTHLYARFAVAFLIPIVVLGGRWVGLAKPPVRHLALGLLVTGALWNLYFIGDLYQRHLYAGGRRVSIEGAPEAFTDGYIPAYEHLKAINTELPQDVKLLLVGEARAFYFLRAVDYRVVFNRDPFVELLKSSPAHEQVRAWLSERGFTHVYVAWSEIRRLGRSRYGFHGLDERQLRAKIVPLTSAGVLNCSHAFAVGGAGTSYAELFEMIPQR